MPMQSVLRACVWLLAAAAVTSAARAQDDIAFQPLNQAVARGVAERKVIVVQFGAPWCGWCRKMKSTTLRDPKVLELADRFVWAEVDIDQRPDLAAVFGVSGVPATVMLNAKGQFLAARAGYLTPSAMVDLLREHADKAEAPSTMEVAYRELAGAADELAEAEEGESADELVARMLTLLPDSEAGDRPEVIAKLKDAGRRAWPSLVAALSSDRLATRAAAYDVLVQTTGQSFPFDPFADVEARLPMTQAWRQWLASQGLSMPASHRRTAAPGSVVPPKPAQPADDPQP